MIKHQMIFKKIVHVINNNIVKNNLFPYNIVSISQNIVLLVVGRRWDIDYILHVVLAQISPNRPAIWQHSNGSGWGLVSQSHLSVCYKLFGAFSNWTTELQ